MRVKQFLEGQNGKRSFICLRSYQMEAISPSLEIHWVLLLQIVCGSGDEGEDVFLWRLAYHTGSQTL